jgi:ABC-type nitrate/sulfonate/bicarbonate transport system substrate-binding protein
MLRRLFRFTGIVVSIAFATSSVGGPARAVDVSDSPPAAPAASPAYNFGVASQEVSVNQLGYRAAIDSLNEAGHSVTLHEIAQADLVPVGVIDGSDFQFASGGPIGVYEAVALGEPLKFIGSLVRNEWTFYARTDITSCQDLDGKRLAIHSEGSLSTVMVRKWIETNCPEITPNYLIIAGSDNRYAALLADQIDASPLELQDAVRIDREAPDRYAKLVSFADALPEFRPQLIYGNSNFMTANPDLVLAYLSAIIDQNRRINGEPGYLARLAERYGIASDDLEAITNAYIESGQFSDEAALDEDDMAVTLEYYGFQDRIEIPDILDLTYLTRAQELRSLAQ